MFSSSIMQHNDVVFFLGKVTQKYQQLQIFSTKINLSVLS